jgi:hypothetical protein
MPLFGGSVLTLRRVSFPCESLTRICWSGEGAAPTGGHALVLIRVRLRRISGEREFGLIIYLFY